MVLPFNPQLHKANIYTCLAYTGCLLFVAKEMHAIYVMYTVFKVSLLQYSAKYIVSVLKICMHAYDNSNVIEIL